MVHLLLNVNYVTALFIFLKFRLFNLNFFVKTTNKRKNRLYIFNKYFTSHKKYVDFLVSKKYIMIHKRT